MPNKISECEIMTNLKTIFEELKKQLCRWNLEHPPDYGNEDCYSCREIDRAFTKAKNEVTKEIDKWCPVM